MIHERDGQTDGQTLLDSKDALALHRAVKKNYDSMFSRFHLIPEHHVRTGRQTDGRTDGQTDRIAISISRVSVLMHDNNHHVAQMKCEDVYCNLL